MKPFCENEHCDNPGAKVVPVSVSKPGDQMRTLCVTCEEAYSWGVQHGTMAAHAKPVLPHLDRFLKKDGFVILTRNDDDPSRHGPFEAWAYQGPLDFDVATPVVFGAGDSIPEALDALDFQIEQSHRDPSAPAGNSRGNEARPNGETGTHPALQEIHDLLYLDVEGGREYYEPEKSWDADTLEAIADVVGQYIPRPKANEKEGTNPADPEDHSPLSSGQCGPARRVLRAIVTVSGGVADVLCKPSGVALTIIDYDVEGADEHDPGVSSDPDGQACCICHWEASEEVRSSEHWPLVKEALEGSYLRSWLCPSCGRTSWLSYEELAEVGSPICGDCDTVMHLT